jgi:hypothetical protein
MVITADTTPKKKIEWLFPEENQAVTIEDFCEMVREAERQSGYSYQEHKKIVNQWQQDHR